jgi:hypothetical protein
MHGGCGHQWDGKARGADRHEFTDHSVIDRKVEMRSQDYGLRGIAAAGSLLIA